MKSRRIITLLCIAAVSVPLFAGTPSNAFTLPVVGFFESGLDTYQSFVRVTNLRPNMAQAVRVEWLGANGDLTTRNAGIITVGPLESRFIPTLSVDILHGFGVGAVHLIAVNADGSPDPDAQIDGVEILAKTLGPQAGEVRQTFEAIHDRDLSHDTDRVRFVDATFNLGMRVNVAIVNLDLDSPATFAIEVAANGQGTTQVTVAPGSLTLVPVRSSARGSADVVVHRLTSSNAPWTAVASGVDEKSGGIFTLQRLDPNVLNAE
jgi:hypothetical protein